MPTWKKVVISGSAISQLANDSNYLVQNGTGTSLSGSFSGSFFGDGSNLSGVTSYTDSDTLTYINTLNVVSSSAQTTLSGTTGYAAYSSSAHTANSQVTTAFIAADSVLSGSAHTQRVAIESGLTSDIATAKSEAGVIAQGYVDTLSGSAHIQRTSISSSIATTISGLSSTLTIKGDTGLATDGVNLVNDQLTVKGASGQITTTVADNEITVGFVTNPTVSGNLTVTGDLTVTGTTFEAQITNLNVEDRFILLNSGSTTGDSGIIFGGSDGTANAGSGLFFDNPAGVFGFASAIGSADISATHTSKLGNIETTTSAPSGAPTFQGAGTIHINSTTGDVFIYS